MILVFVLILCCVQNYGRQELVAVKAALRKSMTSIKDAMTLETFNPAGETELLLKDRLALLQMAMADEASAAPAPNLQTWTVRNKAFDAVLRRDPFFMSELEGEECQVVVFEYIEWARNAWSLFCFRLIALRFIFIFQNLIQYLQLGSIP